MNMTTSLATLSDPAVIARIYDEGIEERFATFEPRAAFVCLGSPELRSVLGSLAGHPARDPVGDRDRST
jgi:hypothetical protein